MAEFCVWLKGLHNAICDLKSASVTVGLTITGGSVPAYVVTEGPDNVTTAAISLAVSAIGAVKTKTVVLLTPEEIDQASKKTIEIRPPGACESQLFRFPKRLHGFNRPGAFSSSLLAFSIARANAAQSVSAVR